MHHRTPSRPRRRSTSATGFTLIELIVVMAIVSLLVALALPRYAHSVQRGRETVLRHDLRVMREAIDRFLGDRGRYPTSLEELVEQRYLRSVPADPLTESRASWRLLPPPVGQGGGVYDVRSGAPGQSEQGGGYEDW